VSRRLGVDFISVYAPPFPVTRCLAGVCTIPWENDTMHAVITVYALALGPREIKASDLDGR
jgi:hypothetical protein